MDRYVQEPGINMGIGIDTSVFGELEILGMVEEIQGYIKDEKKTLTFNYTEGSSVHSGPFLYQEIIYFAASDHEVYAGSGEPVWAFPTCPQNTEANNDKPYSLVQASAGSTYSIDIGYKTEHEYVSGGKYRK